MKRFIIFPSNIMALFQLLVIIINVINIVIYISLMCIVMNKRIIIFWCVIVTHTKF